MEHVCALDRVSKNMDNILIWEYGDVFYAYINKL